MMNELNIILGILLLVFVLAILGLLVLGLKTNWGPLFWGYLMLFFSVMGLWGWNSVYKIRKGQALDVYFFESEWGTYANGSLYGNLLPEIQDNYNDLEIETGHFGDFCFFLWGIFDVVRFPTVDIPIKLMATSIFTASTDNTDPAQVARFPRIICTAEVEIVLRFLTLRKVLSGLSIPRYKDYTVSCDVPIHGTIQKSEEQERTYQSSRLAYVLAIKFQPLVAEATRKAATYFNWEGADLDIQKNKHDLEIVSLYVLAQRGSHLEEAGILIRPEKGDLCNNNDPTLDDFKNAKVDVEDFWSPFMRSVDLNIDKLVPAAEADDPNAINKPLRGQLEARRRVIEAQAQAEEGAKAGEGRAQALKLVLDAAASKNLTDAKTAYLLDALRTGDIPLQITQFGGDISSMIDHIISGGP